MGMFDSVYIDCPGCNTPLEFQSKAGKCRCDVFTEDNAPIVILDDIKKDSEYCDTCKKEVKLNIKLQYAASVKPYFAD